MDVVLVIEALCSGFDVARRALSAQPRELNIVVSPSAVYIKSIYSLVDYTIISSPFLCTQPRAFAHTTSGGKPTTRPRDHSHAINISSTFVESRRKLSTLLLEKTHKSRSRGRCMVKSGHSHTIHRAICTLYYVTILRT